MTTATVRAEFKVETSMHSLGYNLPQRMGRLLWLPMFLMWLMLFAAGMVLGVVRASEIGARIGSLSGKVKVVEVVGGKKLREELGEQG